MSAKFIFGTIATLVVVGGIFMLGFVAGGAFATGAAEHKYSAVVTKIENGEQVAPEDLPDRVEAE